MIRSIFGVALAFLCFFLSTSQFASAQNAPITGSTQITGIVLDAQQRPVGDAQVRLSGPVSEAASTAGDGTFAFHNLPSGNYSLNVTKAGYASATEIDVAGGTTDVHVTLAAASLTVIGNVSVTAHGTNTINTTPASIVDVPATTFTDQGQLSVNQVLNEEPGVTIGLSCAGYGANASGASPWATGIPSVRGGLPYETESLIDGHPIVISGSGFFSPSFISPYELQNVEVVKGPGATAPSINYAINGTINYRTLEPTLKREYSVDFGMDQYGGNFANFRATGTLSGGRLSYAFDYTTEGTPGFARGLTLPLWLVPCAPNGVTLNGSPINAFGGFGGGVVPPSQANIYGTGASSTSFLLYGQGSEINQQYSNQRNELAKIRYAFTPSTALTVTYLGWQSLSAVAGANLFGDPANLYFAPPAGYTGSIPAGLLGPTATGLNFRYGANQVQDTNFFEAEFHTPLGKNTTLQLRQYSSSIVGFFGGPGDSGPTSAPPTTLTTGVFGGVFVCTDSSCATTTEQTFNGQLATINYQFYAEDRSYDHVNGYTAEIDQQLGDNLLSLSYDQQKSTSYGTGISCFGPHIITEPAGSGQKFQSVMGRYEFELGQRVNATLSDNLGSYTDYYTQNAGVTFVQSTHTYQAPRFSLTWRPNANQSFRVAAGVSIAPPYLSLLNNNGLVGLAGTYASTTGNSGDVLPETAFGFDLGLDTRLHSPYTVLSVDVYQTLLRDQFLTTTTLDGTYTQTGCPSCGNTALPLYVSKTANLGHSEYEGIELALHRTPPTGWGYRIQGSLQRAFAYDLPAGFYDGPAGPDTQNLGILPNENFQSAIYTYTAIAPSRIPYSSGYGEINFRGRNGAYFLAGITYYGPNNAYNQPAFGVVTTSFSQPLTKRASLELSVYNLMNAYPSLVEGFNTTPILTPLLNNRVGLTIGNNIGPSNARLTLHIDM